MTRSFDDARRAAQRFEEQMAKAKASPNLMTEEQMQAAGFAPQPPDPNAGLPRYEDVVGPARSEESQLEQAVEGYLQQAQRSPVSPPPYDPREKVDVSGMRIEGIPESFPQPTPQPDNGVMGLLLQQNQQLMADNAALREQLMQLMQMIQVNGQVAPPQQKQVRRAGQMTEAERERIEYSGAGLLG